jgi:hypothetical protein
MSSRPGELHLSLVDIDIAANGQQIFYPLPGNDGSAGGGTFSGATQTAGDSIVLPAGRVAVLYMVAFSGTPGGGANSTRVFLERHDGTVIAELRSQGPTVYRWGPEGIRVPDFRVRLPVIATGDPDMNLTLLYGLD